jgi:low temperature requirement protein LtrA
VHDVSVGHFGRRPAWYDYEEDPHKRQKTEPMVTSWASWLVRRPEQTRSAFLELFFDLVFVFAFFQLSQQLLEHLSWTGAFQTLLSQLAVFVIWFFVMLYTDTFNLRHPLIQLAVMSIMLATLVMAAATPEAFGRKGLVFVGSYLSTRLGGNAFTVLLLRGHEAQRNALRILFWAGMSAVPWIAGAFLHGWARAALWTTAVAVDYLGIGLGFPTPRLGRGGTRRIEVVVSEEHTAERYQQFFIIALGEPILVTGLTFAAGEFRADRSAATLLAFTITALLWRIYIHRAGALIAETMTVSHDLRKIAVLTIYSHAAMVAGVVAIAVANELVIKHPFGHTEPAWVAVILGAPALFLTGRAAFEYVVFGRVSAARVFGALALVAIIPAMRSVPLLAVAAVAALVLAGVAVADEVRSRKLPSEPPLPPG